MSEVKELNYFAFDFPNVQKITFKSELDYLKVFEKANHLAIGEASPFYLYSQVAFTNIRKFNPKAKIILTLRSPINFVQSFHQLNLSLLREDEENLEKAWELQDQRRQGKQIPASCRQPEMILYGELGLFGKYVERLLAIFPRDQVLIIIFEDFARHPQEIYEKILAFIGVPSDGRTEFPPVNSNFSNKSKLLAKIFHPPQSIYKAFIKVISLFGVNFMKFVSIVYNKIETLNTKRTNREPLSPEFKAKLKIYFQKDVQTLSALMNRDLSFWLE